MKQSKEQLAEKIVKEMSFDNHPDYAEKVYKRSAVIAAIVEAMEKTDSPRWVKASERLPEYATTFNLKVDERCGFGKFFERNGEICLGFESMNGFGTLFQYQFDMVEWLEETPQLLNNEQNVKVSDTRNDAQRTKS